MGHGRSQERLCLENAEHSCFSCFNISVSRRARTKGIISYKEIPPGLVLPVISLSQASAHSRTISVAYLYGNMSDLVSMNQLVDPLLVLALARESKLVLRLAVRNLVDSEPLVGCSE